MKMSNFIAAVAINAVQITASVVVAIWKQVVVGLLAWLFVMSFSNGAHASTDMAMQTAAFNDANVLWICILPTMAIGFLLFCLTTTKK